MKGKRRGSKHSTIMTKLVSIVNGNKRQKQKLGKESNVSGSETRQVGRQKKFFDVMSLSTEMLMNK